ncbi:MAG TPA: response regulator [Desulfuromonadaceae bacterium]
MSATVMIVDDSLFMRNILCGILKGQGFQIIAEAASGIEAVKHLHELKPDIIVLDIILPDANGLDLLVSILETNPLTKVVICSAIGQEPVTQKAFDLGATAFICKPITPESVIEVFSGLEG